MLLFGSMQMRVGAIRRGIGRFLFAVLLLAACHAGRADIIVAPNLPHATFNSIPFGVDSGDGRYQQVFDASIFSEPISIESLGFAPNGDGAYAANVAIRLGVTATAPGALSTILDDNVTSPLTTVFLDPSFSQFLTGGSEIFNLFVDFSLTPFPYDPADGNLLLDVLISDKSGPGFFSRFDTTVLSSRAGNLLAFPEVADNLGLRTQITFSSEAVARVPEPDALLLVAIGITTLMLLRRRGSPRRPR